MSRWFRLYTEVLNDPKVQRLDAEDFRAWVNILCIAAQNEGKLPDVDGIAFALRRSPNDALTLIERLCERSLIDRLNGGPNGYHYAPHGWAKRQYKSDTSTDRVKRFRKRSETVKVTPPETETETDTPIVPKGTVRVDPDFDVFWEAYPHKVGKQAAQASWRKAKGKPAIEIILTAISSYRRTKPSDRAWCNPATWINQGRWDDVVASSTPRSTGRVGWV